MLSISGKSGRQKYCNGISRRDMLQIGAAGLGAGIGTLGLADLLRAESNAGIKNSHKSLIMIYLCGGPPHQDMYDIKTDAPSDIRGEFSPIKTNVAGVEICELMPKLAKSMDKAAIIRSMVGARDSHYSYQCMTGHHEINVPAGGWPHVGSAVSHFEGPVYPGVPPFVSLCYTTKHRPYNEPGAGFLGLGNASFRPTGPSRDNMVLQGITSDQLADRKRLLSSLDGFRRNADRTGSMDGMDVFSQRAMGILTSSDLFDALDVSKESKATRERYGEGDLTKPKGDAAPIAPQNFLLARRLVEAGVRVVTINYSFWDWHGNNFKNARNEIPVFDQGISALIEDLHDRGLSDDVTVCAWGEFGRTPKINKNAGRDHWPGVCAALLAGGGMKTGQVIGATDRLGGEAADRPVTFPEVFATLYRNLGIDLSTRERIFDFRGQPQNVVDPDVRAIKELI